MTHIRSGVFAMALPVSRNIRNRNRGFTLVELMIAMAVGGIVMAAVMTAFMSQHRSYLAQDDVVEMQQNVRVAMDMLVRDIRSAGYNPNNIGGGVGITTVGITAPTGDAPNSGVPTGGVAAFLTFSHDDGTGVLETIDYSLFDAFEFAAPPANDGFDDDLAMNRNDGSGRQVVAENINRLEFLYLDANGTPTATLNNIRSIQVSIMAQTSKAYENGPAAQTYTTPSGAIWTSTAGFRSRYLTTTVQCRNLGM